jgi:hypothetical protein
MVEAFFTDLGLFILDTQQKEAVADVNVAESVLTTMNVYLEAVNILKQLVEESNGGDRELLDFLNLLGVLQEDLAQIYTRWTAIEAGVSIKASRIKQCRGRPKVIIEADKIDFLRELGFSWSKISELFGVCRRTLYSIRTAYGMVNNNHNFTEISDRELLEQIMVIKSDMPEIGYSMMRGMLRSKGIFVPVLRIQQCLREVDPVNTALRYTIPLYRRRYSVPHTNFVWHMDGNHKLVRLVHCKLIVLIDYYYK